MSSVAGSDWVAATIRRVAVSHKRRPEPWPAPSRSPPTRTQLLPMMAATLLTDADCVIRNVPGIADVFVMAELLRSVGAVVDFVDPRTLHINTAVVRRHRSGRILGGEDARLGSAGRARSWPVWSLVHAPSGGRRNRDSLNPGPSRSISTDGASR